MTRIWPAATWVAATALTVATAVIVVRHPDEAIAGRGASFVALQTGAAVLLVIAGAFGAPLLVAAAVVVDLQALPVPYAGGAVLFTLALALAAAAAPLVIAPSLPRPVGAATVGIALLWAGVLPTTLLDARATGCFDCPRNLLFVRGNSALRTDVLSSGLRATAVALIVAVAVLVLRSRRAYRSLPAIAGVLGAAVTASGGAVLLAHRATGGSTPTDHVSRVAWAVTCSGIIVVAAAPLSDLVRVWLETTRVVDALLAATPSADALRATLAASAVDDTLAISFDEADPPPGAATTDVVRAGEVIARLSHRELQRPAATRLTGAVRAAGLAIEHVSARTRLRAQLDELTASRARIVAVADAERQRLERNLHDGAQQRLIALSVALAGRNSAAAEARTEVLAALEDLRTLAHGIHPASLTEGGVATSARELADAARVPLRLDVQPAGRLPPAVEAAAYRVIADSVRAAERSGRAVGVELTTTDRRLQARLTLEGVPPITARHALAHATDRVVAVGGTVEVREGSGETLVEVRIECGS